MGFWNSFKGQLGKDTARAVSRKLYGDKHAILYRRIESNSSKANLQEKIERETELRKLDYKYTHLQKLSGETDRRIQQINSLQIPTTQKGLDNLLGQLLYLIKANSQNHLDGEEEILMNAYVDTLFAKYEHILTIMGHQFPTDSKTYYYSNQYKILRKKRFWKKNGDVIRWIVLMLVITTLAFILE